jgi:hypothetical protein
VDEERVSVRAATTERHIVSESARLGSTSSRESAPCSRRDAAVALLGRIIKFWSRAGSAAWVRILPVGGLSFAFPMGPAPRSTVPGQNHSVTSGVTASHRPSSLGPPRCHDERRSAGGGESMKQLVPSPSTTAPHISQPLTCCW